MTTLNPKSGTAIPQLFYGVAWKEAKTDHCVTAALNAGFRAIDSANQRKHYFEEAAGVAVQNFLRNGKLAREELFLQSKFTYRRGQDHRLPYNEDAPFPAQVRQSLDGTLRHFGTSYLDSFLLHGPATGEGLAESDWELWRAMEEFLERGLVRAIGVANFNFAQLQALERDARLKPSFIQNRCYATSRWDKEIRAFCHEKKIGYQGFSLLTANREYLQGEMLKTEGRNYPQLKLDQLERKETLSGFYKAFASDTAIQEKSTSQIIFRFALQGGMIPLTGTQSEAHMAEDLHLTDFSLSAEQLDYIENIALRSKE